MKFWTVWNPHQSLDTSKFTNTKDMLKLKINITQKSKRYHIIYDTPKPNRFQTEIDSAGYLIQKEIS